MPWPKQYARWRKLLPREKPPATPDGLLDYWKDRSHDELTDRDRARLLDAAAQVPDRLPELRQHLRGPQELARAKAIFEAHDARMSGRTSATLARFHQRWRLKVETFPALHGYDPDRLMALAAERVRDVAHDLEGRDILDAAVRHHWPRAVKLLDRLIDGAQSLPRHPRPGRRRRRGAAHPDPDTAAPAAGASHADVVPLGRPQQPRVPHQAGRPAGAAASPRLRLPHPHRLHGEALLAPYPYDLPPNGCLGHWKRSCYSGTKGCTGKPGAAYKCEGICQAGAQSCTKAGTWSATCTGEVTPLFVESCNTKDDDCDGVADNGVCYSAWTELKLPDAISIRAVDAQGKVVLVAGYSVKAGVGQSIYRSTDGGKKWSTVLTKVGQMQNMTATRGPRATSRAPPTSSRTWPTSRRGGS